MPNIHVLWVDEDSLRVRPSEVLLADEHGVYDRMRVSDAGRRATHRSVTKPSMHYYFYTSFVAYHNGYFTQSACSSVQQRAAHRLNCNLLGSGMNIVTLAAPLPTIKTDKSTASQWVARSGAGDGGNNWVLTTVLPRDELATTVSARGVFSVVARDRGVSPTWRTFNPLTNSTATFWDLV